MKNNNDDDDNFIYSTAFEKKVNYTNHVHVRSFFQDLVSVSVSSRLVNPFHRRATVGHADEPCIASLASSGGVTSSRHGHATVHGISLENPTGPKSHR